MHVFPSFFACFLSFAYRFLSRSLAKLDSELPTIDPTDKTTRRVRVQAPTFFQYTVRPKSRLPAELEARKNKTKGDSHSTDS